MRAVAGVAPDVSSLLRTAATSSYLYTFSVYGFVSRLRWPPMTPSRRASPDVSGAPDGVAPGLANPLRTLIVCGVTTEMCMHTTVREANDRGFACVVLSDCVDSYSPEFQRAALETIEAQGGILGWLSDSAAAVAALEEVEHAAA